MRKNIVITGASSGLGEEMARQFAAKGRNLALCARRTDRLDALKTELEQQHPGITVLVKTLDVCEYGHVFEVVREFDKEFQAETGSGIDRFIVNAGLGKGQPVGTGYFWANKETAETNFIGALAQCEVAMELFRERKAGHLVMISSMSAMRGMRGNITTYAATKSGVAALVEGIRMDVLKLPKIKITTIFPGFIRSEINEKVKNTPFIVSTETGVKAMVKAIESETPTACTPRWPWAPLGYLMKRLPLKQVAKIS